MKTTSKIEATEAERARGSALDANKQTVISFYELALNNNDFEAASKLIGPRYVQHNPVLADGIAGLKDFIGYRQDAVPALRTEINKIFAEDEFVIAHAHGVRVPGQRGSAIVEGGALTTVVNRTNDPAENRHVQDIARTNAV